MTVQCYRGDLVLALELQLAVVLGPQHDMYNYVRDIIMLVYFERVWYT